MMMLIRVILATMTIPAPRQKKSHNHGRPPSPAAQALWRGGARGGGHPQLADQNLQKRNGLVFIGTSFCQSLVIST